VIEEVVKSYLSDKKHPLAEIHKSVATIYKDVRNKFLSYEGRSKDPFSLGWEYAAYMKRVNMETLKRLLPLVDELSKIKIEDDVRVASALSMLDLVAGPYMEMHGPDHPISRAAEILKDNLAAPNRQVWTEALGEISRISKEHKEWRKLLRTFFLKIYNILRKSKSVDPERVRLLIPIFVAMHELTLKEEASWAAPVDIRARQNAIEEVKNEADRAGHKDIAQAAKRLLEAYRLATEGHGVI